MLGSLTSEQIEEVLQEQKIGRIGCCADSRVYVVPVSYAYDGEYVYAHSSEGMKIHMMRKNPNVCFEVDTMQNLANWQSVIGWGYYQELHGHDAFQGIQFLVSKFMRMMPSETAQLSHGLTEAHRQDIPNRATVIYRIRLMEKTGRFEKR